MLPIEIVYARPELIPSFYLALSQVGSERKYIEMIEPPPLESIITFQNNLISANMPVFYAVRGHQVVGWCDIKAPENPRLCHRGHLGMGLIREMRGIGLGHQLLVASIEHARKVQLEKIELMVYSGNDNAIRLYQKLGFVEEGLIKNYRKLDGKSYDALAMAKFLV